MQRSAFTLKATAMAAGAAIVMSTGAMAETFNVRLDKAEILRLDEPASIVIVGNPSIADVTVENPNMLFLTGLAAGETNLIILDDNGEEILEYDLVVTSEIARQVTVHRNVDLLTTFSCKPRCIEVANPSEIERQRQFSDNEDEEDVDAGPPPPRPEEEANADSGGGVGGAG